MSVDEYTPPEPGAWTFKNPEIAAGFDVHVRTQLPWYPMLTRAVAHWGRHYITEGGLVYDVGASNGNIGRALADTLEQRHARLIAIEESRDMCDLYDAPGVVVNQPAQNVEWEPYDFATCMLLLMFLPPDQAVSVLEALIAARKPAGALVIVEKLVPPGGYKGVVMNRLTLSGKLEAGVTPEQIVAKELSLAGVQRPFEPSVFTSRGGHEWFRLGDFAAFVWAD